MRKVKAFTIIELLIALSLSSFIIMGMMQGQRNVMRFVRSARNMMLINRKVCLLFNQFERDMTTAIIPTLSKPVKKEKSAEKKEGDEEKPGPQQSSDDRQDEGKKKKSERERNKIYFMSRFYEDLTQRINKEKFELLKDATWICTNPLQVYGQKKVRLTRVGYELIKDKQKSTREKAVYKLMRNETTDLANFEFKEPEEGSPRTAKTIIRRHLVADYVKGVYLKFEKPLDKPRKGETTQDDEQKMFTTFEWSKDKQTFGVVPRGAYLYITFYDEDLKKEYTFNCFMPILSYPTKVKKEKKALRQASPYAEASEDSQGEREKENTTGKKDKR